MHEIQALIGPLEILGGLGRRFPSAVVRELPQRFALVPITDAFAGDLVDAGLGAADPDPLPALEMAPGVAALAAELSAGGPVLYVATLFFGGTGGQDALVWGGGKLTLALCDNQGEMSEWPNSPISRALRSVGVKAAQGEDEFDALGLGSHRRNSGWAGARDA